MGVARCEVSRTRLLFPRGKLTRFIPSFRLQWGLYGSLRYCRDLRGRRACPSVLDAQAGPSFAFPSLRPKQILIFHLFPSLQRTPAFVALVRRVSSSLIECRTSTDTAPLILVKLHPFVHFLLDGTPLSFPLLPSLHSSSSLIAN